MAKYTDVIRDTIIAAFNAGDQPTEAQFTNWITRIQEGIEEHDHDGSGDGDGMTTLNFGNATTGGLDIGWAAELIKIGGIRSSGDPFIGKAVKSDGAVADRLNYATVANIAKMAIVLNNDGIYFATKAAAVDVLDAQFDWEVTYARMVLDPIGQLGLRTPDPLVAFHMTESAGGAEDCVIRLSGDGNNLVDTVLGRIEWWNADASGVGPNVAARIEGRSTAVAGYGGDLVFHVGGAAGTSEFVMFDGRYRRVGVEVLAPLAKVHIDQLDNVGAIPVLTLDQADISEEFINFDCAATGAGNPVDTATAVGANYARLRVAVNGTFKYIQLYDA